jgi:hypothetical protein
MSKGHARREADLANLEAEFFEALELAKKEKDPPSAFVAERQGRSRGAATALDVKLFTLESKIVRLRELLAMPPLVLPLGNKASASESNAKAKAGTGPGTSEPWPSAPELEGSIYALDPLNLWNQIVESGRDPAKVFTKVKCAAGHARQNPEQASWRLCMVECGDGKVPAKLTLTLFPLPDGPDAHTAAQKLDDALTKLVTWSEKTMNTHSRERAHSLQVHYTRATRELQFSAR